MKRYELLIVTVVLAGVGYALYATGALTLLFPNFKPEPQKIELYTHPIPGGTCLIARTHEGQVAVGCVEVK